MKRMKEWLQTDQNPFAKTMSKKGNREDEEWKQNNIGLEIEISGMTKGLARWLDQQIDWEDAVSLAFLTIGRADIASQVCGAIESH